MDVPVIEVLQMVSFGENTPVKIIKKYVLNENMLSELDDGKRVTDEPIFRFPH